MKWCQSDNYLLCRKISNILIQLLSFVSILVYIYSWLLLKFAVSYAQQLEESKITEETIAVTMEAQMVKYISMLNVEYL